MDANGTRFHLLLGERDWASCRDAANTRVPLAEHFARPPAPCGEADDTGGFGWARGRAELTLRPCVVRFETAHGDRVPATAAGDRRGAARDRFGNVYWIAESSIEIRILPAASGAAAHFWSPGDGPSCEPHGGFGGFRPVAPRPPAVTTPRELAGLAVTDDHYLVAGVVDPPGLLVFDLHAGGPPRQLAWPADVPGGFTPFDLAARAGGGVWVLDRVARRYWALDRHCAVDTLGRPPQELEAEGRDDFQPVDPAPIRRTAPRRYPEPVAIDASDPVSIEGLPDGSVLILDVPGAIGRSRLLHDGANQQFGSPSGISGGDDIDAYDIVFAGTGDAGSLEGRVFAASLEGNQAYAFDVSRGDAGAISVTLANEYFPMRLFGGKALIGSGSLAFYDFFDGWIPLVSQRRPRYATSATLLTPTFDGGEPDCVWHRLMLDACIPPDTALQLRSRTAEDPDAIGAARWQREPDPYLRRDGSELPFAGVERGEGEGTWELLFQHAKGRHLQLELTLTGNGRVTPRLRSLRAYYPRFSYLARYLPAVYREDAVSASFLDRFLANTEGFFTTAEDRIAAAQAFFDVRSAPAETLEWLAGWFGVALDPSWSEAKRRMFIRHATDFFRQRGTTRGLQAAIRLAIDDCADETIFEDRPRRRQRPDQVRIVETWRTRRLPAVVAGDPTGDLGPREVPSAARWIPAHGRSQLNERYRTFLKARGITTPDATEFPVQKPPAAEDARLWRAFAEETLGFVPTATAGDTTAWREFLIRRYSEAGSFARAYGVPASAAAAPPTRLPADGAPLADWYDFELLVMGTRRTAHRFSVLLPVPRGGNIESRRIERLDLVRRVVELEKPAHTVFDVKFYWGLFRIGEARLGHDTLIERGGRDPDLLPPLRLGETYLAETHLAPGHPFNVAERRVVGRDQLETRA